MSVLSNTDEALYKILVGKNTETKFSDILSDENLVNILKNIDGINTKKLDYITSMLSLFNQYYDSVETNMYSEDLCLRISKLIIKEFCCDKYNSNYPTDMFSGNFIKYLYDYELLYTNLKTNTRSLTLNVFQSIINDKKTIDYFKFSLNTEHIEDYEFIISKLTRTLNTQIYTYLTPSQSLLTRCLNFLGLIQNLVDNKNDSDVDDEEFLDLMSLLEKAKHLYMLIYSSVSDIISIDSHTLNIYTETGSPNNYLNSTVLVQMQKQIHEFKTYIDSLRKLNYFSENVISNIEAFKIENSHTDSELIENQVRTITYLFNTDTFLGESSKFNEFVENTKRHIPTILKSDKINIHNKTKLVLELDEKFLSDNIDDLINLFIDIEKYNPESGYNEKHKLRNKVLNVLIYSDKVNYLSKLCNDKLNEFITILTSHFLFLFTQFKDTKVKLENVNNYNPTYTIQIAVYTKYLDEVSKFISKFTKIDNITKNSHFIYKQIELYFSIIQLSVNSRIYSEVPLFQNSSLSRKILTPNCSKKLECIYQNLFTNLEYLSKYDNFIEDYAKHTSLFNSKEYEQTVKYFGEFVYNIDNKNKISDLIIKLVENIENKIKELESKEETFDEPIPDKFLDPIMCTPIEKPIEIPGVKQIVDYYTINNHLTFSHTNPFTNSPLTKEELRTYNEEADVKERIKKFSDDLTEWKTQHKI